MKPKIYFKKCFWVVEAKNLQRGTAFWGWLKRNTSKQNTFWCLKLKTSNIFFFGGVVYVSPSGYLFPLSSENGEARIALLERGQEEDFGGLLEGRMTSDVQNLRFDLENEFLQRWKLYIALNDWNLTVQKMGPHLGLYSFK